MCLLSFIHLLAKLQYYLMIMEVQNKLFFYVFCCLHKTNKLCFV